MKTSMRRAMRYQANNMRAICADGASLEEWDGQIGIIPTHAGVAKSLFERCVYFDQISACLTKMTAWRSG